MLFVNVNVLASPLPKMASLCSLRFHSLSSQHRICSNGIGIELRTEFGFDCANFKLNRPSNHGGKLVLTASTTDSTVSTQSDSGRSERNAFNLGKSFQKLQQAVASLPPVVVVINKHSGANLILGFFIATTCLIIAVRIYVARQLRDTSPGSVADLVRRGQLRSDRRGISKPLKYEDPFNNPLVKVSNSNTSVEMCGTVYRLAPVTLTEEQRAIHQKRRSRAYQWKRPKVFLKEGDAIPPDVDPDTVRWIPANHPFATTVSDIDEDLAQNNVYQKHGVPFRIQAEHEALQKKLEALQGEQKFNKLVIDPVNAKDFERAFRTQSKSHDRAESGTQNGQLNESKPPKSDPLPENSDSNAASPKDEV
ncbi:protein MULTIPLE CHLOROPLAST DIVISION SITE 1-like isoform X1 [Chenopodium quinoa]|uniref:protein MULTIPLE CHLOROPLAST DIVISION SITE 1-like isoform X1 n=1 Tax=Chenopodium quinoa TaxID=63459 RepID=UPI000B7724FD|nr:protein MULTIPLE CHLOROPLAST DIVISION SITE 1-like isoform X1 [Chenopodium quinoa]